MLGKISWLLALLSVSGLAACGSDSDSGDSGGGGLGSGVDSDKLGEDLTQAEVDSICAAAEDYLRQLESSDVFNEEICRFAAARVALDAGDPDTLESTCDVGYDTCVDCRANPDEPGCANFDTEVDLDCQDEGVPENCTSTVFQIEACLKANIDQTAANFYGVPTCGDLTEDTELPTTDDLDLPGECETVAQNCPAVLD